MARKRKPKPATTPTTRRPKRFFVLIALFVFLFCVFQFVGGVAGFARSFAKSALLVNNSERASSCELAENEYALAMKKDPSHAKSAWRFARLLCGRNKPEEAIKILNKIRNGPQELAVKTFLASCYFQMGEIEKSRILFRETGFYSSERVRTCYSPARGYPTSQQGVSSRIDRAHGARRSRLKTKPFGARQTTIESD